MVVEQPATCVTERAAWPVERQPYTIWVVLHEAGLTWQQSRTWYETGQVKRRRKSGMVSVSESDAEAKEA